MDEVCKVDSCRDPQHVRALCKFHYRRWYNGDRSIEVPGAYVQTADEILAERVEIRDDGCHYLLGVRTKEPTGYGSLPNDGVTIAAHKYVWEKEHGKVPEGFVVDHKCHTKRCVNLLHLRLATDRQNSQNQKSKYRAKIGGFPRGVYSHGTRYVATVVDNGTKYQEKFDSVHEATEWVQEKRKEIYGEFAGGS